MTYDTDITENSIDEVIIFDKNHVVWKFNVDRLAEWQASYGETRFYMAINVWSLHNIGYLLL